MPLIGPAGQQRGTTAVIDHGAPLPDRPEASSASFDAFYRTAAARLTQQTFLVTGHRHRAVHCVRRAFQLAWTHWDEVSADLSPEGWVRSTAFGLALSPWRPTVLHSAADHGTRLTDDDHALLRALQRLPRAQRRALVLHDAVGLTWKQTAAEVESSTPAAYGRVVRARLAMARLAPTVAGPNARERGFGRRLGTLLRHAAVRGCPVDGCPVATPVRVQHRARLHDGGVTTAAGLLSIAATAGVVAALVWGVPWHRPSAGPASTVRPPQTSAAPVIAPSSAPVAASGPDGPRPPGRTVDTLPFRGGRPLAGLPAALQAGPAVPEGRTARPTPAWPVLVQSALSPSPPGTPLPGRAGPGTPAPGTAGSGPEASGPAVRPHMPHSTPLPPASCELFALPCGRPHPH
ncbi:sigma factor-like helix-turn-helix DNA-binding protein [Streptacidiphilus sp. EB129]|uniref:sigma factor-like helix-turn-helix DNA-binding protein n=1 Tax=Streptacidiphilus sp. EB129 TaxID=3156262 RepID=UPI0035121E2F